MSSFEKISPSFESFLREAAPNERREAIVVTAAPSLPPLRGRLRALQDRLRAVERIAREQGAEQAELIRDYQKLTQKQAPDRQPLRAEPIGGTGLPITQVDVTPETLPTLAARPQVVGIMPNQRIDLIRPSEQTFSASSTGEVQDGCTWGLAALDVPRIWETTKGEQINVAVLDTGVYGDHPALAYRVKGFVVIDPLGRRIETDRSFDSGSHGTHVCGTVAGGKTSDGISIGVAPEANLLVAGVLIGNATLRTLLEGISWAVERGADIISMSLGFAYYEPLFAQVFDVLIQRGVLPIAAIGNSSHGSTSSPGNAYNAFAVGAAGPGAAGRLDVAFFSSGASLTFPGADQGGLVHKPDVVAPGVRVLSCIPAEVRPDHTYEYNYMDGTSMATPHVAGAAALLMAAKPDVPVTDIAEALKASAEHPLGPERRPDNRWGYGMIRPVEALKVLG